MAPPREAHPPSSSGVLVGGGRTRRAPLCDDLLANAGSSVNDMLEDAATLTLTEFRYIYASVLGEGALLLWTYGALQDVLFVD